VLSPTLVERSVAYEACEKQLREGSLGQSSERLVADDSSEMRPGKKGARWDDVLASKTGMERLQRRPYVDA